RGIHLVGRYRPRVKKNSAWSGQRIEIQLRSQLQHSFATAVETVTTFTRQPLKFGAGPEEWRRFFSLVGSTFAIREGTPLVPGTPVNRTELVEELRQGTKALNVERRLRAWTNAIQGFVGNNAEDAEWLLLVLDIPQSTVSVTGFNDRVKAAKALAAIEKQG